MPRLIRKDGPPRKIKVRIPLPKKPPKVIAPETVYDRKKEKKGGRRYHEE